MRRLLARTKHPNGQVVEYWAVGPEYMAQEFLGCHIAYKLPIAWLPDLIEDIQAIGGTVQARRP